MSIYVKRRQLIDGAEWEARALRLFYPRTSGDDAAIRGHRPWLRGGAGGRRPSTKSIGRASRAATRISRRHKLGLFGQELAALASFFEAPFTAPSAPACSETPRAGAEPGRHSASRAWAPAGRRSAPMRAAVAASSQIACGKTRLATLAISANCSSPSAGFPARRAPWRRAKRPLPSRTALAMSVHAHESCAPPMLMCSCRRARWPAPGRCSARLRRSKRRCSLPARLYSLQGYHYCDLLLARGRAAEAAARASWAARLVHAQQARYVS